MCRWISCKPAGHGACRYDDAYAYQNVFGPLVALEAAHDRAMKESQVHSLQRYCLTALSLHSGHPLAQWVQLCCNEEVVMAAACCHGGVDDRWLASQARHNIAVRWDTALNQRRIARFVFPRDDSALRLVLGALAPGPPHVLHVCQQSTRQHHSLQRCSCHSLRKRQENITFTPCNASDMSP